MRIHILQQVPFEDEGYIRVWAKLRGHTLTRTRLFGTALFPPHRRFDALIVLGGPMNVYDYERYSWLLHEKTFILDAMEGDTPVLGIDLGAQLIADVLGAGIRRNPHRKLGWFPVSLLVSARRTRLFKHFPPTFVALHWHDDTFDIPPGAVRLASSEACANQAFKVGERILGLQFHLECSRHNLQAMIRNAGNDPGAVAFVQGAADLLADPSRMRAAQGLLFKMLDAWTARRRTAREATHDRHCKLSFAAPDLPTSTCDVADEELDLTTVCETRRAGAIR